MTPPARHPPDKKTKILATLGPASSSVKTLTQLLHEGANAFRLNCSHASLGELTSTVHSIRHASAAARIPASIVLDLQGPRLRTGRLRAGDPVELKTGTRVTITTEDIPGTSEVVSTNYRDLPKVVAKGSRILLDEGNIELVVAKTGTREVTCEVIVGGKLKEHKGINLPGTHIDLPAVTPKDRRDLEWGLKLGVDYVALSFVQDAKDIQAARTVVKDKKSSALIIAKIERPEAIVKIHSILDTADGIMVARGDLAVELTASDVPVVQKLLIGKANDAGKMVIVATQMLESMIHSLIPTRAEASDVANAIFDGADAVMLSAETAVGINPVNAVKAMSDIIAKAESSAFAYRKMPSMLPDSREGGGFAHALARAASAACEESHARAIIVFTLTGWSARIMSKYRPPVPIYSLTPEKTVFNQMALQWGVIPLICPLAMSTDPMIQRGEKIVIQHGLLKRNDVIIVMAGGTAKHRASNMIKIHPLGAY
ncbi:MAG: pyruvate kinase [Elusimicrobia bacterium]|nr:pyruvate kinase [Elusimicrobiota bacterium]